MTDRSNLIDKVAEAICRIEHPGVDDEIVDLFVAHVPKYQAFARAAIDAMELKERDAEIYANGYADAVRYQAQLLGGGDD